MISQCQFDVLEGRRITLTFDAVKEMVRPVSYPFHNDVERAL